MVCHRSSGERKNQRFRMTGSDVEQRKNTDQYNDMTNKTEIPCTLVSTQ